MSTTVCIILDTRRMKIKSGTFSIKLQVTFQRVTQHYQTVFDLSKEDYKKLPAPRINSYLQNVRKKLNTIQRAAEDCINQMDSFSFYEFEKKFVTNNELFKPRKKLKEPLLLIVEEAFDYSFYKKRFPIFGEDHSRPGSISIVYLASIKTLLQEERIGTALSYQHSYNSLKKFKGNVIFTEITISYLNQYEQWMTKRGRSRTTVGIKLRPLRTIFNEAIGLGMIKRENCYPFGRRKYQIPTGRNIKKALELNDISSIYYYQPECSNEKKAKDYWLFCYFGNGMNPKDLVYLKNKDIQDGYLVFVRAKTERATRNDPKPIIVYISEDMWEIIQRYRNKDKSPDAYIFPIMDSKLNPLKQYELVAYFTKFINEGMFSIGQRLGIEKKITTIVSRHSFSTQLKRSGATTEYIQEALGHTDKKTTENYLDSFGKELKKQYADMLVSFKKNTFSVVEP